MSARSDFPERGQELMSATIGAALVHGRAGRAATGLMLRYGRRRRRRRRIAEIRPRPRIFEKSTAGRAAFLAQWRGSAPSLLPESRPEPRGGISLFHQLARVTGNHANRPEQQTMRSALAQGHLKRAASRRLQGTHQGRARTGKHVAAERLCRVVPQHRQARLRPHARLWLPGCSGVASRGAHGLRRQQDPLADRMGAAG